MPNARKSKAHRGSSSHVTASPSAASTPKADASSSSSMRRRSQKPPGVSKAHEEDGDEDTEQQGASAMPKIPRSVVGKLVSFSLLLLVAPILCYFVSLKYIFVGATASSAIVAVITANLVLAAFVYSAWNEELEDRQPENKDSNRSLTKQAAPRE